MNYRSTSTGNVLVLICSFILLVKADYHIGFSGPVSFNSVNNNTLSNGNCCNENCTECSVTLRYCFREAGHPTEDTTSSCLLTIVRTNPTLFLVFASNSAPIMDCYTGSFQIYIRVSHNTSQVPDFDPPFTDPLIDNIFIEVSDLPAALYEERNSLGSVTYQATGEFGIVTIGLRVMQGLCADGYNGSDCNTLCQELTEGEVTCEQVNSCSTRTDAPTTTVSPTTPVTPTEGPLVTDSNNDNIVVIAVGATIGGILLLVILLVFIGVIVICIRRSRSKGSYEPREHHNIIHYPLASNRDSVTESHLKSRPKSIESFSSESQSTSSNSFDSAPVADMYSTVNKTGTKGPYIPPYIPKAREYQAFNQPQDINSNKGEHLYQNTISLQEQKNYGDMQTENSIPQEGHDQDGLVYADLDISRQGTMHASRESMEVNGVAVNTSAHASTIVDEDIVAEPYDNIKVQYTTVQHSN